MWLVGYQVDTFHMIVQGVCKLVTSVALALQWRMDHARTHYVRAFVSLLTVPSFVHLGICGYGWPGEECDTTAWTSDILRPFRVLMCLAALRMFLNGCSLICQNMFPERGVTANYGNEQLFFRSLIRFSGIPLYAAMTLQAISTLQGTQFQRPVIELVVNLIRCCIIIPILWAALAHQWR